MNTRIEQQKVECLDRWMESALYCRNLQLQWGKRTIHLYNVPSQTKDPQKKTSLNDAFEVAHKCCSQMASFFQLSCFVITNGSLTNYEENTIKCFLISGEKLKYVDKNAFYWDIMKCILFF